MPGISERPEDLFRELMNGADPVWWPALGEVESYSNGRAKVRPLFVLDSVAAPSCVEVPVLWLGAGGWQINLSLSAGDRVLLIFCGHNVRRDNQETSGSTLSNAVAIPFGQLRNTAQGVTIKNESGTVSFEMSDAGTKITGNLEVTGTITAATITPATQVGVSTHTHPFTGGTTSPPTPGT
jgi:hypothetical protein